VVTRDGSIISAEGRKEVMAMGEAESIIVRFVIQDL